MTLQSSNKSQGIALNTVVLAAIALGILVVIFLIFTGQFSNTSKTLQSCQAKGGICAETNKKPQGPVSCDNLADNLKDYKIPLYVSDKECGESKLCCIKI